MPELRTACSGLHATVTTIRQSRLPKYMSMVMRLAKLRAIELEEVKGLIQRLREGLESKDWQMRATASHSSHAAIEAGSPLPLNRSVNADWLPSGVYD